MSPFNEEKTPSFSVRRETGKFFDFSSGIGGTIVTFVQFYFKTTAHGAIEMLKEYAGASGKISSPSDKMSAVATVKKFMEPKRQTKEQKEIKLPADYMSRFEIRPEKLDVWRKEDITDEAMEKFGVRYDSFSNRIVYPIYDDRGNIINVGGRTLDPDFKEKGLRKYTYFHGFGSMSVVYGLWDNLEEIKKQREIIIFEGCKSVLKAYGWGIRNTGAILTSHLSPGQMKTLVKLGCRVVFALDKDVDIRKDHNINKLKNYVNVDYICDMADWLQEKDSPVDQGEEVFRALYDRRFKFK